MKYDYPEDCPVFILTWPSCCKGLHVVGMPSDWGGINDLDFGPTCNGWYEPFRIDQVIPLTKAAKDLIKFKYP